jgi:CheY-like chemotaxis protein
MKRVLLVCNSVLTREVLVGPLTDRGYEVLSVEDTWEAVGVCGRHEVDLLVIELDWPGDDGWTGWELINGALEAEPRLPVVLLTGRGGLPERRERSGG